MRSKDAYLNKLMEKKQRSFYLYDEAIVKQQIDMLKNNLAQFELLYSIKTNPFAPVVKYMVSSGLGADAASAQEVEIARDAGLQYEQIFYSAAGKSKNDIESAFGKAIITADSLSELAVINTVAKQKNVKAKVGIRINPEYAIDGASGASSKFGVDEEALQPSKGYIDSLDNVEIVGIHVHLRSQILDWNTLYKYYKAVFELSLYCQNIMGWQLSFINFGGGLGIPYSERSEKPLDIALLAAQCETLIKDFKQHFNARLLIETGRFVICQAGTYVTRVVDIKQSRGKKYIIVQHALTGFMRPTIADLVAQYSGSEHPAAWEPLFTSKDAFECKVLGQESTELECVDIVGNLCTSADVLARNIMLQKAEIGDVITVSNAGSYAYSLTPMLFSSHDAPLQIYLKQRRKHRGIRPIDEIRR